MDAQLSSNALDCHGVSITKLQGLSDLGEFLGTLRPTGTTQSQPTSSKLLES